MQQDQDTITLAARVAAQLGRLEGIVAVTLGGSHARGVAQPDSDIDVGVYYDADKPPSLLALRQLAQTLGNPTEAVTDFGAWGPWVDGGAWLTVAGRRVDWLYRDLERVRQVKDECLTGRASLHRQGGHPHGFHNHMYLAEVHYARPLYDPQGVLSHLQAQLWPYPPRLKKTLIESYLWQAGFDLLIAHKSAARGDSYYVTGCFFECVSSLIQVLFALNERYFINQKGSVAQTRAFRLCPPGFEATVVEILGGAGTTPATLERNLERLDTLIREVRSLAGYPKDWHFQD